MAIVSQGIDLAEVPRIAKMLEQHGAAFLARCFTAAEQAYCGSFKHGAAVHYAGRFAAKEAVMKALGTGWRGQIAWTDMEIINDANGKPELRLSGESAKIAAERGIRHWHISITHTDALAMASAIAES